MSSAPGLVQISRIIAENDPHFVPDVRINFRFRLFVIWACCYFVRNLVQIPSSRRVVLIERHSARENFGNCWDRRDVGRKRASKSHPFRPFTIGLQRRITESTLRCNSWAVYRIPKGSLQFTGADLGQGVRWVRTNPPPHPQRNIIPVYVEFYVNLLFSTQRYM